MCGYVQNRKAVPMKSTTGDVKLLDELKMGELALLAAAAAAAAVVVVAVLLLLLAVVAAAAGTGVAGSE